MSKLTYTTLSVSVLALCAAHQARADDEASMEKARAAYYGAKARGLSAFQCNIVPNWNVIIKDILAANPTQGEAALTKLKQIAFTVKAGPAVATVVTHNSVQADNDKQAKGLQQIYSGMEQEVSGFFATYSAFMFTKPVPEAGVPYQLTADGDKWNLAFKEGDVDVQETLDSNFSIEAMRINSSAFKALIKPQLQKSNDGFVLAGYEANYDNGDAAQKTVLNVNIEHQATEGFQLPKTLSLSGTYGEGKFVSEVAFTDCHLVK